MTALADEFINTTIPPEIPEVDASAFPEVTEAILRLRDEKGAVILAHNYQRPEVQDVADFVGDSLALSRSAAEADAGMIVFCGVHFMAETAAILCPDKRVYLPDLKAGCSLAAMVTADELREWKKQYPDAVVVSYVNTTAAVKALSDYCCTSTNAVKVVESIPEGKEILFLPDIFLGAYVEAVTGRALRVWPGECHVHAGIRPDDITHLMESHPGAEFLIHPECGCVTQCMYFMGSGDVPEGNAHIYSTEGMVQHVRQSEAEEFIVATETGILYRLRQVAPNKRFIPASEDAVCQFMKQITLDNVLTSLRDEVYRVTVPDDVAVAARRAIDRMVSIG
jgi:quinolinate synthase